MQNNIGQRNLVMMNHWYYNRYVKIALAGFGGIQGQSDELVMTGSSALNLSACRAFFSNCYVA